MACYEANVEGHGGASHSADLSTSSDYSNMTVGLVPTDHRIAIMIR